MALAAFRVYPSTPESVEYLKNVEHLNEVHIVLAFARDYDATGLKNGKFVPYFNPNFTPEWIREFKSKSKSTVKVFLSIGGRNPKYPFRSSGTWVNNAIESLKVIVNNYRFDGIDVYYEYADQVNSRDGNGFAVAIREVISKLKESNERFKASLTVSAPAPNSLNEQLYLSSPSTFDHVVCQSHTVTTPISTVDKLVQVFDRLTTTYPKSKIFAGHSILSSDWKNVPRPIFLGSIPKLLEKGIVSISEWTVTDHDPEA